MGGFGLGVVVACAPRIWIPCIFICVPCMSESEFQELEARAEKLVDALHASSFVEEIGAVVPSLLQMPVI